MLIYLNGETRDVNGNPSVEALLEELGFTGKRVAVEVNQEIVPRSEHKNYRLQNKDRVEVVKAIGGG